MCLAAVSLLSAPCLLLVRPQKALLFCRPNLAVDARSFSRMFVVYCILDTWQITWLPTPESTALLCDLHDTRTPAVDAQQAVVCPTHDNDTKCRLAEHLKLTLTRHPAGGRASYTQPSTASTASVCTADAAHPGRVASVIRSG